MDDWLALVLVEQGDCVDEGEIFLVVAAGSGASAGESQVSDEALPKPPGFWRQPNQSFKG
jgi:hypothetical protein